MNYWLVGDGTKEEPHVQDDWWPRRKRWIDEYGDVWQCNGGHPSIVTGDRLITYAVGSQRTFGKGRVFSLYEVISDPEPGPHERWDWQMSWSLLAAVPLLSQSPTLDDIGVKSTSVRSHTHISLTPEQGRRAEELIRARGRGFRPPR